MPLYLKENALLMTCKIMVSSTNGSSVEARAILDPGSTTSFITERLANTMRLNGSKQAVHITGIMGTMARASTPSVTTCMVSPIYGDRTPLDISAVILLNITRDMPIRRITIQTGWSHIDDLMLADPKFGEPGRIDALFGVEVYVNVLNDGRQKGPPGALMTFETDYRWILCGSVNDLQNEIKTSTHLMVHHVMTIDPLVNELIKQFLELEEVPDDPVLSQEEKDVVQQFEMTNSRNQNGRFVIILPRRDQYKSLGESRSQVVR